VDHACEKASGPSRGMNQVEYRRHLALQHIEKDGARGRAPKALEVRT